MTPRADLASRWLPLVIRLFAASLLTFFGLGLIVSTFDVDLGHHLMSLIRWGMDDGRHYEVMIETIYVVWAVFLWRAAADPARNALFLDFTVWANAAHFTVMAAMGVMMDGEHQHLYGDVLLGFLGLAVFAAVWFSARPSLGLSAAVPTGPVASKDVPHA